MTSDRSFFDKSDVIFTLFEAPGVPGHFAFMFHGGFFRVSAQQDGFLRQGQQAVRDMAQQGFFIPAGQIGAAVAFAEDTIPYKGDAVLFAIEGTAVGGMAGTMDELQLVVRIVL